MSLLTCANKDLRKSAQLLDYSLTSTGIGDIQIGQSFSQIANTFDNATLFRTGAEGIFWDVLKIDLGQDEWIQVETKDGNATWQTDPIDVSDSNPNYLGFKKSRSNDVIRCIKTNSKRIKTKLGIHPGMNLAQVEMLGESFGVASDYGGLVLRLKTEAVLVRLNESAQKTYFERGGEFPQSLDSLAEIEVLIAI